MPSCNHQTVFLLISVFSIRKPFFLLSLSVANLLQILQTHFGYTFFRPQQEEIMNAVMQGKDVLALLPTGGGKSLCYQVPALAKGGLCLVVSPLIALMKDQVLHLRRRNIAAAAVVSGMSFFDVKNTFQHAADGLYKFLYVSPERLQSDTF